MPRMSKQQRKDHVEQILIDAGVEVENGHWDNALLITRRASAEILRFSGKAMAVSATSRANRSAGFRESSSLIAGFNILACFTPKVSLLGIKEASELTGMPRSTAHRYMTTLVTLGQLEQDPATRKYRRVS